MYTKGWDSVVVYTEIYLLSDSALKSTKGLLLVMFALAVIY